MRNSQLFVELKSICHSEPQAKNLKILHFVEDDIIFYMWISCMGRRPTRGQDYIFGKVSVTLFFYRGRTSTVQAVRTANRAPFPAALRWQTTWPQSELKSYRQFPRQRPWPPQTLLLRADTLQVHQGRETDRCAWICLFRARAYLQTVYRGKVQRKTLLQDAR